MEVNVAPRDADVVSCDARPLRIAVVSDVRIVRETLGEVLERDPLVSVVRLCADISEAVAVSPALETDVILLDATVPGGAAMVKRALNIGPGLRIIAFSVREMEENVVPWAEAGAIGYIPNTVAPADVARLVLDIQRGEQVCQPNLRRIIPPDCAFRYPEHPPKAAGSRPRTH